MPIGNAQPLRAIPLADLIDVESELLNLSRPLTKDPRQEYPFKQASVKAPVLSECNYEVDGEHSRLFQHDLRNNINLIRNNDRTNTLCFNPQDPTRLPTNTRIGLNSRVFYKDNYVPKVPVPKSQESFIPKFTSTDANGSCMSKDCNLK